VRSVKRARLFMRAFVIGGLLSLPFSLPADDGADGYRLLELDGSKVKWGKQELGVGARVSYAFADEMLRFDDARNCREVAPISALSGEGLSTEKLVHEAEAAFRVWERASGLSFHEVADARDADIVVGAQGRPRGWAFADVSYASAPKQGVRVIDQALVCLNPHQEWKVGFDGNKDVYDIRYTLIHEIGHAIGLDHPGPSGQVMGFRYTEAFGELQPGDLRGVQRLYGPGTDDDHPVNGFDIQLIEASTDAYHASNLIGSSVLSAAADEEIGSINDLVLDQDGNIVAVVVAIGGYLGIGEKNVALSWESVDLTREADEEKAVVRVHADKGTLDGAPEYEGVSSLRASPDTGVDG